MKLNIQKIIFQALFPDYYFLSSVFMSEKKVLDISNQDQAILKAIAKRVKELRKKKQSNYEVFAYEHGVNRTSLYRLENAKGNFTMNTLLSVLRALEVSPEEFFKGIK